MQHVSEKKISVLIHSDSCASPNFASSTSSFFISFFLRKKSCTVLTNVICTTFETFLRLRFIEFMRSNSGIRKEISLCLFKELLSHYCLVCFLSNKTMNKTVLFGNSKTMCCTDLRIVSKSPICKSFSRACQFESSYALSVGRYSLVRIQFMSPKCRLRNTNSRQCQQPSHFLFLDCLFHRFIISDMRFGC